MTLSLRSVGAAALCALAASCASTAGQTDVPVAAEAPSMTPWEVIGTSRGGRAVRAVDLGAGGPRLAYIASIHGDEQEGARHLDDLVELLRDAPADIRLYEDANPDGSAANRRTTDAGVDPNRNWPARNFRPAAKRGPEPLSEPAVAAVHADLVAFDPQLVIVLHSASRGPFVNYDGPAAGYAERFARAAGGAWTVEPSMGYETPGSLGSFMGVDRGVPILTIEFRRGSTAEESRGPLLRASCGDPPGSRC
ncbi:MAG: M14 family zinc carboxypeptidase, partial [Planctomycetota bacterium]